MILVATIEPAKTQEMAGNIRCQSYDQWDTPSLNLFYSQPIVVGAYRSGVLHERTIDADARFGDYTLRCEFEGDGFTVEGSSAFKVREYLFLPQIRSQRRYGGGRESSRRMNSRHLNGVTTCMVCGFQYSLF